MGTLGSGAKAGPLLVRLHKPIMLLQALLGS